MTFTSSKSINGDDSISATGNTADRNAPSLRVGIIGYSFMGSIHAQSWTTAPRFFPLQVAPTVAVICGRNRTAAEEFAAKFEIDRVETEWEAVVNSDDIDIIDICTPSNLHAEIAIAALSAGKHVLCEKPLANSIEEAEAMAQAAANAEDQGVRSMVGFSYRRTPALAYAKQLVQEGRLGDIRHIRAVYLQDWIADTNFPLVWRLDKEKAGSGALGDIGAHILDIAEYVTGHTISGVSALTETFVKTRPLPSASSGLSAEGSRDRGDVTVDDAAVIIARTHQGALATFEATRFATGRKNALRIEVNGSKGSLSFDFESLNELFFYDAELPKELAGFRRILVTEPEHPYAEAWWPAGHGLGYDHAFVHQAKDFVNAILNETEPLPSFRDGLHIQRLLTAAEQSSRHQARWTDIPNP